MKTNITRWEDIIFESRNKNYGAYELRVTYDSRVLKSMLIVFSVFIFTAIIIYHFSSTVIVPAVQLKTDKLIFTTDPFIIDQSEKTTPPPKATPHIASPTPDPDTFVAVEKLPVTAPVSSVADDSPETKDGEGTASSPMTPSGDLPVNIPMPPDVTFNQGMVDKIPEFPGGIEKFYSFLQTHLRYPAEAVNAGIKGRLFVSFIIDKNGRLINIDFANKAGFGMEESVTEALQSSPLWSPGIVGQEKVSTKMVLPVTFNLIQ